MNKKFDGSFHVLSNKLMTAFENKLTHYNAIIGQLSLLDLLFQLSSL
jgi:hypothetical protein